MSGFFGEMFPGPAAIGGLNVYVTEYGQVIVPEPVRQSILARAWRKNRPNAVATKAYAARLLERWARGTTYFLWKNV